MYLDIIHEMDLNRANLHNLIAEILLVWEQTANINPKTAILAIRWT